MLLCGAVIWFLKTPSVFKGKQWRQFEISSSAFNHSGHLWLEAELILFFFKAFLQHCRAGGGKKKVISFPTLSAGDYMRVTQMINSSGASPPPPAQTVSHPLLQRLRRRGHLKLRLKVLTLFPPPPINPGERRADAAVSQANGATCPKLQEESLKKQQLKNTSAFFFFSRLSAWAWDNGGGGGEPDGSVAWWHVMRLRDSEEGGGDAQPPAAHVLFSAAANLLAELWDPIPGSFSDILPLFWIRSGNWPLAARFPSLYPGNVRYFTTENKSPCSSWKSWRSLGIAPEL